MTTDTNEKIDRTSALYPRYAIEIFRRRTLIRGVQFYFRIVSTFNGQIVAPSEGYKDLRDCHYMARQLVTHLHRAPISGIDVNLPVV